MGLEIGLNILEKFWKIIGKNLWEPWFKHLYLQVLLKQTSWSNVILIQTPALNCILSNIGSGRRDGGSIWKWRVIGLTKTIVSNNITTIIKTCLKLKLTPLLTFEPPILGENSWSTSSHVVSLKIAIFDESIWVCLLVPNQGLALAWLMNYHLWMIKQGFSLS